MRSIDLNADVGEGGPLDDDLLGVVSSAAVACGFHAGSPLVMLETARVASRKGVVVGAHPSYDDRTGFGRKEVDVSGDELVAAIVYQVGAMAAAAAAAGTSLRFVKPHGALYNRAATDSDVASAVIDAMGLLASCAGAEPVALLCLAGSKLARRAAAAGIPFYREAFADRRYAPDGGLVSRSVPGSVLDEPEEAARQAVDIVVRGRAITFGGDTVDVEADSICVHGDTAGAFVLARAVKRALQDHGVPVAPFAAV